MYLYLLNEVVVVVVADVVVVVVVVVVLTVLLLSSGTIKQDCGDGSYLVEDSVGDLEQIYRPDIITEADDAENEIGVHDPVIALHPSFPYAYAPGTTVMKICLFMPSKIISCV